MFCNLFLSTYKLDREQNRKLQYTFLPQEHARKKSENHVDGNNADALNADVEIEADYPRGGVNSSFRVGTVAPVNNSHHYMFAVRAQIRIPIPRERQLNSPPPPTA